MTQEIITYLIGVVTILIIGRWIISLFKGGDKSGCTTCDGCQIRGNCTKQK